MAKKAVDSTLRRILNYTAEIIMSIILLILVCIPLAFVIPMWFQTIALGIPRTNLALDPVHLVGADGAIWLTLFLGLVSFVISYAYILKMKPGVTGVDEPEVEVEPEEDEEEEDLDEEEEEKEEVEATPDVEEDEPLEEEAEEKAAEDSAEEGTEEED